MRKLVNIFASSNIIFFIFLGGGSIQSCIDSILPSFSVCLLNFIFTPKLTIAVQKV